MYLFVFIFILVSVLGLYTQVYMLQAARVFANQKAIGEIMQTWAGGAYTLAGTKPAIGTTPGGCSLTPALAVPAACASQMAVGDLPNGYNFVNYSWNTIVFQPVGGPRYVITYVSPPASIADPITAPRIGYTVGQIYQQLRNTTLPKISYGPVVGGVVVTREIDGGGAPVTYPVPQAGVVPNGAVAIIYPL